MKRNVLLIAALFGLLGSCAPAVSGVVKTGVQLAGPAVELAENDPATFVHGGKDVLLTNKGTDALTGDPSRAVDGVSIVLVGTPDLVVTAKAPLGGNACSPGTRAGYWRCFVPVVLPGQAFRVVPKAGAIQSGSASYYRASRGALLIVKNLK